MEKLGVNMLNPEVPGIVEAQEVEQESLGREGEDSGVENVPEEEQAPVTVPVATTISEAPVVLAKDEILKGVEDILSKGIADLYKNLAEDRKPKFRAKGEEVAHKIREMIAKGKIKVHAVLKMIKEWLHSIPGINRFFLEQEAKIKTDLIIAYGEGKAHHSMNAI